MKEGDARGGLVNAPTDTQHHPNHTLVAVAQAAALFTRLDEAEYRAFTEGDAWRAVTHELNLTEPPLPFSTYRHFTNNALTAGMPLAALPVESLYRPWSELEGAQGGNRQGLYRSDSALHIEALCEHLDLTIPPEFRAMPDHLALLTELLTFLDEYAPAPDARAFARDHFAWLPAYRDTLHERGIRADDGDLITAFKFYKNLTIEMEQAIRTYQEGGETE